MYKSKIASLFLSTLLLSSLVISLTVSSEEEQWLVEDIRISGLQRVFCRKCIQCYADSRW